MPRRELLNPAQRLELFAFPDDRSELIRLATLSKSDLAFASQHRGVQNRLGIAVQMVYLRHPGKALGVRETPHAAVLEIVATQLRVAAKAWDSYAARGATRRDHLLELFARLGLSAFTRVHERELGEWLLPLAMQTTQGMILAQTGVEELRRRRIVPPTVATLERVCAVAATNAQREIHRLLTVPLTVDQRSAIDKLLEQREGMPISTLAWLRKSPGGPSARAVLAHIDRLSAIRGLGLPQDIGRNVHQNRLLRIAREGAQTAVFQLQEYETERRHATLVAILIDTAATLTDEILNLHDRLIGSFFTRAKNKYSTHFAADGKALNDKVRLYARVGSALVAAKDAGLDPFKAIEEVLPWDDFARSVQEAEKLARDEEFDSLALLVDHFGQLRRYAPTLLETFDFRAGPARRELLDAVAALREMNRTDARRVPSDAPTEFIRPRWKHFVFRDDGGIDRKFYEFAVMSELKNALRSGDVWVLGSRQFKDFDEYLLPRAEVDRQRDEGRLGLPVPTAVDTYLEERVARLRDTLDRTAKLAAAGELPDVELTERGLKISPIEDETPEAADALKLQIYNLLPRVKITDLLLEVDRKARKGWLSPAAINGPVVYVSDDSPNDFFGIKIYSQNGHNQQPIGEIPVYRPAGIAVDNSGNLYVTSGPQVIYNGGNPTITNGDVLMFKNGQVTPSKTYISGIAQPNDVAIGGDGTVYVANYNGDFAIGWVSVYRNGSVTPSATIEDFD